jgi:hypothetical protein
MERDLCRRANMQRKASPRENDGNMTAGVVKGELWCCPESPIGAEPDASAVSRNDSEMVGGART